MSDFTCMFREQARLHPDNTAYSNSAGESFTYAELDALSERLGALFAELDPAKDPVVLYGHKSPYMLAGIIACSKSGRAFVPVDSLYPVGRLHDIAEQIGTPILVNTTPSAIEIACARATLELDDLAAFERTMPDARLSENDAVHGADPVYIMFTSGSTGKPKGVVLRTDAIDLFTRHYVNDVLKANDNDVFFNRSPFSFDLSVFDLLPSPAAGAHLYGLDEKTESSFAATFEALAKSGVTKWTSTPSYLEACLADPSFSPELLPRLELVILCGEVLHNQTALRLLERFPGVTLINTYGATETQACSEVLIDEELARTCTPLPAGIASMDMKAFVVDRETGEELPVGEVGEIYLAGPTVALGYYKNPDRTAASFTTVTIDGQETPLYKTGDRGYLDDQGRIYCLGRFDFQVKLGGYRIEIGDIEQNLRMLPAVREACVVPVMHDGSLSHLCAFVQLADAHADTSFAQTKMLKQELAALVPSYMVPRAFKYLDPLPSNVNGKIDRKLLAEMAGSK